MFPVLEIDFLKDIQSSGSSVSQLLLKDIDAAYYLIHSMSSNLKDFGSLEETSANNFIKAC